MPIRTLSLVSLVSLLLMWLAQAAPAEQPVEGSSAIISEIRFEGNEVFTGDELLDALRLNRTGGPYNPGKLDYDLQVNLSERYRRKGYINVKVGAPRAERSATAGSGEPLMVITVPIEEGEQYVFGKIEVAGMTVFPDREVWQTLGIQSQEICDSVALKTGIERLRDLYRQQGYLDADLVTELDPDPDAREVDVVVRVNEGAPFVFGKVHFELALVENPLFENNEKVEQDLQASWLLEEGDLCRQDLVEESIRRINALGYFEAVERRDWKFTKDGRTADVVVRLTQKQKWSPRGNLPALSAPGSLSRLPDFLSHSFRPPRRHQILTGLNQ